jgi:hypothetical protein
MTKVVKLHPQPTAKGNPWFMTDDLQVGRRLRFRSYKLRDDMIYTITGITDRNWNPKKVRKPDYTTDRIRLMSQTGRTTERGVMGVRISVNWELLDD